MPAFFFLSAVLILFLNKWGILSVPGMAAGVTGVFFTVKKHYKLASLIGVTSAFASFTAQVATAFCPHCTGAALMFTLAGVTALINVIPEKPLWSLIVLPVTLSFLFLMARAAPYQDRRAEAFITPVAVSDDEEIKKDTDGETLKPRLYVSVSCGSCEKALEYFIRQDPEGERWQPVIIPNSALPQGEKILRELGYRGEVHSVGDSPAHAVPCLEMEEQIFVGLGVIMTEGKEIFTYFP